MQAYNLELPCPKLLFLRPYEPFFSTLHHSRMINIKKRTAYSRQESWLRLREASRFHFGASTLDEKNAFRLQQSMQLQADGVREQKPKGWLGMLHTMLKQHAVKRHTVWLPSQHLQAEHSWNGDNSLLVVGSLKNRYCLWGIGNISTSVPFGSFTRIPELHWETCSICVVSMIFGDCTLTGRCRWV